MNEDQKRFFCKSYLRCLLLVRLGVGKVSRARQWLENFFASKNKISGLGRVLGVRNLFDGKHKIYIHLIL